MGKRGPPKGSQNALKHGGTIALANIRDGKELRGPAREAELTIADLLESDGQYELIKRNAIRVQAACDLYWAAVLKAAEDQDMHSLDRYVARFGWLIGVTGRAWEQVKKIKPDEGVIDYEKLLQRQRQNES